MPFCVFAYCVCMLETGKSKSPPLAIVMLYCRIDSTPLISLSMIGALGNG